MPAIDPVGLPERPDGVRRGVPVDTPLGSGAMGDGVPRLLNGSATPRLFAGLRFVMPARSFGRSTFVGPPRP